MGNIPNFQEIRKALTGNLLCHAVEEEKQKKNRELPKTDFLISYDFLTE